MGWRVGCQPPAPRPRPPPHLVGVLAHHRLDLRQDFGAQAALLPLARRHRVIVGHGPLRGDNGDAQGWAGPPGAAPVEVGAAPRLAVGPWGSGAVGQRGRCSPGPGCPRGRGSIAPAGTGRPWPRPGTRTRGRPGRARRGPQPAPLSGDREHGHASLRSLCAPGVPRPRPHQPWVLGPTQPHPGHPSCLSPRPPVPMSSHPHHPQVPTQTLSLPSPCPHTNPIPTILRSPPRPPPCHPTCLSPHPPVPHTPGACPHPDPVPTVPMSPPRPRPCHPQVPIPS